MKRSLVLSSIVGMMLLSSTIVAGENISVGVQAGIFGIGANAKYKLNDQLGIRAGFEMYEVNDFEVEDDEVTYNFDVKLQDITVLADWHPWKGSFKTSAGLIINNSSVEGDITPSATDNQNIEFTFNGRDYSYKLDELGSIHTTADLNPIAPYIGIGWDTSFDKDIGFGFTFDIGVAFQGAVEVDYSLRYGDSLDVDKEVARQTADLPAGAIKDAKVAQITNDIKIEQKRIKDELKTELDKEMITLQDELDQYEIMPYISIGFNYKF
jgi:hypothetical protein